MLCIFDKSKNSKFTHIANKKNDFKQSLQKSNIFNSMKRFQYNVCIIKILRSSYYLVLYKFVIIL